MARIAEQESPAEPRGGTRRVRYAVAAALSVALVSTGAYAAVRSGLLGGAFGTKGQDDVAATQVSGAYVGGPHVGETFTEWRPGRTWRHADDATVQRLVGSYVTRVDASTTVGSATLTVEDYVTDENGLSVASYTLSGETDVQGWVQDAGYGTFSFGDSSPIADVLITNADGTGSSYAERDILDRTSSDGNALHVVRYYGTWSGDSAGQATSWQLCRSESTGVGDSADGYVTAGSPQRLVPAMTLTNTDAPELRLSVSPLGAVVADGGSSELLVDGLTITYADGSSYVALDETTDNVVEGYQRTDGSVALLFNGLVDTASLQSVVLTYRTAGTDAPQTVTLMP